MHSIDLTPFFESISIKPLLNNSIVSSNGRTYRCERTFSSTSGVRITGCQRKIYLTSKDFIDKPTLVHAYVFIDITMDVPDRKKPFAKKPSYVVEMIKENKLQIKTIV